MKQVYITGKKAYASGADGNDYTTVGEGQIALICLEDNKVLTNKAATNFAIVVGRGENILPYVFSEVDIKSLSVTKAEYKEGATFSATVTIPDTLEENQKCTIIVAKKGVVFNQRNRWSFTELVRKTSTPSILAEQLAKDINYNSDTLGVEAEADGADIIITGVTEGDDFQVIPGDDLIGVEVTDVTVGQKAILDKAYVQNMLQVGIGEKGIQHLAGDKDIYPGYPAEVSEDKYVMYNLRFAVPRMSAKQVDDVTWQMVHICVPVGAGAISSLDLILGVSTSGKAGTPTT